MKKYQAKVCIVGGGSGGIGAAIGAAAAGAEVILVEKNHLLGGTVTHAWVHSWEPVCGSSPLCERLWQRMRRIPMGAMPLDYAQTTCKKNPITGADNSPLPFEPWAYQAAVAEEFAAAGSIQVLYDSSFVAAETESRRIKRICCHNPVETFTVEADYFIDSTADIYLAREAGCAWSIGAESRAEYDEPHAPEVAEPWTLNGVNWIYRVHPCGSPVTVDASPIPEASRLEGLSLRSMPNGDILVNICGWGRLRFESPSEYSRIMVEQKQFAWDAYRWLVLSGRFPDWVFLGFAPQIGIREGYRLKARYVLNENDLLAGIGRQSHQHFVASCDHMVDMHDGVGKVSYELEHPVGIPLECLMTNEYDNLLVACRGAGFSHLAAASCRLSRTILTLGEAAGRFAAGNCSK